MSYGPFCDQDTPVSTYDGTIIFTIRIDRQRHFIALLMAQRVPLSKQGRLKKLAMYCPVGGKGIRVLYVFSAERATITAVVKVLSPLVRCRLFVGRQPIALHWDLNRALLSNSFAVRKALVTIDTPRHVARFLSLFSRANIDTRLHSIRDSSHKW